MTFKDIFQGPSRMRGNHVIVIVIIIISATAAPAVLMSAGCIYGRLVVAAFFTSTVSCSTKKHRQTYYIFGKNGK